MADKREKIHFASVEELLGAPTETGEGTVELKLSEIYGFENHPFKVIDDDRIVGQMLGAAVPYTIVVR